MNELIVRIFTALVGIPLLLAVIFLGGWVYFLVIEILIFGCCIEIVQLFRRMNVAIPMWSILPGAVLLPFCFFPPTASFVRSDIAIAGILFGSLLIGSVAMLRSPQLHRGFAIAASVFSVVYIGIAMSTLLALRFATAFADDPLPTASADFDGAKMVVLFFGILWISDSAAYFVGKKWGKRKIAPAISPGKSWEGGIAGIAAAILSGSVFGYWFFPGSQFLHWIAVGGIIGIVGPIGDLTESAIKRHAGVKDSSHFFPGHGGFLDRFDSTLFAAPLVFFYVIVFII